MLRQRLLVSVLLIPSLVGLLAWDHHLGEAAPVLLVLAVLLALRSAWELALLQRLRGLYSAWPLAGVAAAALVLAGWSPAAWGDHIAPLMDQTEPLERIALVFTVEVLLLLFIGALRFREPGQSLTGLGAELLVIVYTGFLLAVTAQLRWTPGAGAGYLALGSLVVAAKLGDTGAYTLGKLFGRRKLSPRLSPGKTWMGAWGAVLGASLGACLWLQLAAPAFQVNGSPCHAPGWAWAALYGALIGVSGLIGDLCESLMKRDAEVKDSASLLPGMGGVLDLLDSILYAGPVAWLCWTCWLSRLVTTAGVDAG